MIFKASTRKDEDCGVLTVIGVQKTMKEKLCAEMLPSPSLHVA